MIAERDLQEAIAECEGVKNPNANTCIKLAAFYTIRDHLFGNDPVAQYSFSPPEALEALYPVKEAITYSSDTEFSQAIYGMDVNRVLVVIDELMTTLQAINPRLYAGVMRRIAD